MTEYERGRQDAYDTALDLFEELAQEYKKKDGMLFTAFAAAYFYAKVELVHLKVREKKNYESTEKNNNV